MKWGYSLSRVVRDLPEELANYKGFIENRCMMLDCLSQFDDGLPILWGVARRTHYPVFAAIRFSTKFLRHSAILWVTDDGEITGGQSY